MSEIYREAGVQVIAETAHFLSTPYPMLRREPFDRVLRMHAEAVRIATMKG